MATGIELNNLGVCATSSLPGFNTEKGCPYNFKNVIELWRTPADFEFDDTVQFDQAYIKSLQLSGKLSLIKGITDFPEGGTDAIIETLADNTEISAGVARYKYSPTFTQDLWYNKMLGFLRGQGNNRFCFIDSSGNILMTEGSEPGKSRGFLTSRTERGKVILQSPGVGAKQVLEFQLANTYELEDNFVIRNQSSLGFDPRVIDAIVQAYVVYTAKPANSDTTITVEAVVDKGRSIKIGGLTDKTNWSVLVDGKPVDISTVALANDIYTLTIPAISTGNEIKTSLNNIVDVTDDALYKSFPAEIAVIA